MSSVTWKASFARAGAISGNVSNLTYDVGNHLAVVTNIVSGEVTRFFYNGSLS